MDELDVRIETLFTGNDRFNCAQIMMLLSHELRGVSDPGLIRALGGLGGGLYCRKACGTLLGGCCLIASYGAKGQPGEVERFDVKPLIRHLAAWFEAAFGSTECGDLVEADMAARMAFCPGLMKKTFTKCVELLAQEDIDPYE